MEDGSTLIDTIFLLGGIVLIVLTGLRMSHGSDRKQTEGQSAVTIGILVWLGLLGVALYLIFG